MGLTLLGNIDRRLSASDQVEEKGTFRVNALQSQSPRRATSAVRRATFLATVRARHQAEEDRAPNATSAAKLDTLRGLALREALAVEEEDTQTSEEATLRPGKFVIID